MGLEFGLGAHWVYHWDGVEKDSRMVRFWDKHDRDRDKNREGNTTHD